LTGNSPTPIRKEQNHRRGGTGGWVLVAMVAVVVVLVLRPWRGLSGSGGVDPSQAVLGWRHDYAAGIAEAGQLKRPALLLFTADWCPPCRELKHGPLIDSDVAATITSRYVPIKIDLTQEAPDTGRIAGRYGVNAIPALVIVDGDGSVRARNVGTLDAAALNQWLVKLSDGPDGG
jgi:thiol:disulfide interchange protein